jgi:hypothetical protein
LEWRLFIATDPIEETEENEEAMNDPWD